MTRLHYALIAAALLIGVALGYGASRLNSQQNGITREGGYSFVNPLLTCDISDDEPSEKLSFVHSALAKATQEAVRSGQATRVSVYFRDMNSGAWTGVEPDQQFIPASLVKVPLLIAYLKAAEREPLLLQRSLTLSRHDYNAAQDIPPTHPTSPGYTYGIPTLLEAMVADSDNNAFAALNDYISTSTEEETFGLLGWGPASETSESVSPKNFMYAFRLLYNATYLTRADSQHALSLLSKSTFKEGLVGGVPQGTAVSHKFGERSIEASGAKELHDCGIVYYPRAPYGLCVMTQGRDFKALERVIVSVSRAAWQAAADR